MSARIKQRNAANLVDLSTLSTNEKILRECHSLYIDPNNGLIKIADGLGIKLLAPRKKIVVMLIGNHSAGKSTFINWYIEEHVQKTGVAIETQGFTFVTSGKKRESLTGKATLHLYPHFKPLQKIKGVVDYLGTEISTSRQKKFSLVTFVDTPGLVDGGMNYPFDVNEAITWLGELIDLIFVFFDPIGQALCTRTLNLVEKLSERHSDRVRFYLSKADEAGHESDRQRVMMQIVQEVCKRPGLNRTCFDMPTIYIPNPNKSSRCVNQIEEVCKEIEKTINQMVQNTLNTLERDCRKIIQTSDAKLNDDKNARSHNVRASGKGVIYAFLGVMLPTSLFVHFLVSSISKEFLTSVLGESGADYLSVYLTPIRNLWGVIPTNHRFLALCILMLMSLLLLGLAKWTFRMRSTLTKKQKTTILERREYVCNVIRDKKHLLYQEYLRQSIGDSEF